jgi:hypothetical protein
MRAVLGGTFTLRFSTGLTGAMLAVYLAKLPEHGGEVVHASTLALLASAFFVSELLLSPVFGILSDRLGHHRMMLVGPAFGAVAVILTGLTTNLPLLGGTRLLAAAGGNGSVFFRDHNTVLFEKAREEFSERGARLAAVRNHAKVVTIATSGGVQWSGTLPDGTKVTQKSALSKDGIWPLLNHSDCDGDLTVEEMKIVEPRLREIVMRWPEDDYDRTQGLLLADGMRECIANGEEMEFC